MGNQQSNKVVKTDFTNDELNVLQKSYKALAGGVASTITEKRLLESLSLIVDESLAQSIINFLRIHSTSSSKTDSVTNINFELYIKPFLVIERGSIDEKIEFIMNSIQKGSSFTLLALKQLEVYVSSVLLTLVKFLKKDNSERYVLWNKCVYTSKDASVQRLIRSILDVFYKNSIINICVDDMQSWLEDSPLFLTIWRDVFLHLYGFYNNNVMNSGDSIPGSNLVPTIKDLPVNAEFKPILDLFHIIYINSNLPKEYKGLWRLLFSSKIMGESFSTMLKQILGKGPTILIIESKDGHIFGGFATHSWELSPNFIGDERTMLFTLRPFLQCFGTTGYNNHYQYLNLNQETMPNGLGMGGQFNYWGLWLDCEYGKGHSSKSCSSFKNYQQLSEQNEFDIKNLEVWGVGDENLEKENNDGDGERGMSVLDRRLEERVLLELSGRKIFSDGLRELNEDI